MNNCIEARIGTSAGLFYAKFTEFVEIIRIKTVKNKYKAKKEM